MKPTVDQLGELLALRREARPETGYWQDFLREFHQKQGEESVKSRGIISGFQSAIAWFAEISPCRWGCAAALATAIVFSAFMLTPSGVGDDGKLAVPVSYQPPSALRPPPVQQLNRLDLSPLSQGLTGEQIF